MFASFLSFVCLFFFPKNYRVISAERFVSEASDASWSLFLQRSVPGFTVLNWSLGIFFKWGSSEKSPWIVGVPVTRVDLFCVQAIKKANRRREDAIEIASAAAARTPAPLPSFNRFYWVLIGLTGFSLVLLAAIESCGTLLDINDRLTDPEYVSNQFRSSFTGFYRVSSAFYGNIPPFTGRYSSKGRLHKTVITPSGRSCLSASACEWVCVCVCVGFCARGFLWKVISERKKNPSRKKGDQEKTTHVIRNV